MGLSEELISQFVKVTKDEDKTKKESINYGTIVDYEGTKYVRLDGSELLTPISTTTNVASGERVTVMIKNHTATVTGNISSPSARVTDIKDQADAITEMEIAIANKVDTEELVAEQARINALVAENITIKQNLAASNALIEDLEAGNATVTGQLTANTADIAVLKSTSLTTSVAAATYATIENLNTTNTTVYNLSATYAEFTEATAGHFEAVEAQIDELIADSITADEVAATYATIAQLNVEKARIQALEGEVADIDTLMFGSATGNVIQTSFANAVIARLGNAQIKSAMVDSLSASKLSAGDIVTNKIRVVSEDGNLLIADETIQICDADRVRVQIGKDASGDYSINIWDAAGKLMFSEGGITDSAIKDAIIRNDMVSDTANIAAHKLDIDSLFEEINGSTKTIKSSKVLLDADNQTLDVAFESLSTDVDGLSDNVSSQGTKISVIEGKISNKVWQQDIDSATDTMSTKYSELTQEVDRVTTTVASHTSTLSTKADQSTVSEVNDRVATVETDLSGFKTTVSNTYATKTDVNSRVSTVETKILQNENSITSLAGRTAVVENKFAGYSTTEQMNSAITQSAQSIKSTVSETYTTKAEFESLEVGGRNLVAGTSADREYSGNINSSGATTTYKDVWSAKTIDIPTGTEYVVSFDAKADVAQNIRCFFYSPNTTTRSLSSTGQTTTGLDGSCDVSITTEWARYWVKWTQGPTDAIKNIIVGRNSTANDIYIRKVKFEAGHTPTDWSPAPEDMATADDITSVQSSSEIIESRVATAESSIQQLASSIAMLVTDANGESLMTQTSTGWTFSTSQIQGMVNNTAESLDALTNDLGDINSVVSILQQTVDDLGVLSEYINIGTYEGEPCIELGESDSDFKLLITNTRIMFKEGSGVPAYFNNQSLYIKKAVVEEELQQGEFIWKARSNGNLGLIWKGANS